MSDRAKPQQEQDVFTTCIDLPGESVQCWNPNAKKIKIILRKHRDVIVDIETFKGMQYEIWSEHGEIYCANSKRLFAKGKRIPVKDGERKHLWIGRDFTGVINVAAAGKLLGKYRPEELDTVKYGPDPKDKPEPFIISIRNFGADRRSMPTVEAIHRAYRPDKEKQLLPGPEAKNYSYLNGEAEQVMHVVELDLAKPGIPDMVAKFIQSGGEQLTFDAGNVMTRNWIFSQIVGMGTFYADNKIWVHELWGKTFRIHTVWHATGPKRYLIFKGDPQLRSVFTAARYGVGHEKVLAFTAGIGAGKTLQATKEAAKGAFRKFGLVAVLFTVTIDVAEWLKDYSEYDPKTGLPKKDLCDLLVKIGIDLTKGAMTAAITAVALGALVAAGVLTGGVALVVGSIVLAIAIGYTIDFLDGKLGVSGKINQSIRDAARHLNTKMPKDYGQFEMEIETTTRFEFGAS